MQILRYVRMTSLLVVGAFRVKKCGVDKKRGVHWFPSELLPQSCVVSVLSVGASAIWNESTKGHWILVTSQRVKGTGRVRRRRRRRNGVGSSGKLLRFS